MNIKNFMLKFIIFFISFMHGKSKIFERCELAKILYKHKFNHNDISKLVCIAYHQSRLDSSAYKQIYGNGGSHGLFQISDKYWCNTGLCNIQCNKLRDNDINDDINCIKIILDEHKRISADKFTAWGDGYKYYCSARTENYIQDCYQKTNTVVATNRNNYAQKSPGKTHKPYYKKQGKIYERCELAKELYYQHKMPLNQLEDWICIAMHESNFNTSALGKLNSDKSIDHGIFQISDIYWCKSSTGNGYGCSISCDKLLDSNIADDVNCIKIIYNEHQKISGNGFTAWTVYNLHCKNKIYDYLSGCFNPNVKTNTQIHSTQLQTNIKYHKSTQHYPQTQHKTNYRTHTQVNIKTTRKSKKITDSYKLNGLNFLEILERKNNQIRKRSNPKIYQPCDLALELNQKHKIPAIDIPIWVCIAKHESDYNTSAIGYGDHGLFQISEIYWCSKDDDIEKSCKISCNNLEDDDITDDVECIKKIHTEHERLTGDGFNAWTVYSLYCDNGRALKYTEKCDNTKYISTEERNENNVFNNNIFLKPIFEVSTTTELIPKHRTITTIKSTTKKFDTTRAFKYQTSKSTTTQKPQTLKPTTYNFQNLIKPELPKITTKTTPKTSSKYISTSSKIPKSSIKAITKLTTKSTTSKTTPKSSSKYISATSKIPKSSQSVISKITTKSTTSKITTKNLTSLSTINWKNKYNQNPNEITTKKYSTTKSLIKKISTKQTKYFISTTNKITTTKKPITSSTKRTTALQSKNYQLNYQKSSTKSSDSDGKYNSGRYDNGQYDSSRHNGKYNSGTYDGGIYNSGVYNSGKYETKVATAKSANSSRNLISKRDVLNSYLNLYRATPKPN